jgi:hypothetical protein
MNTTYNVTIIIDGTALREVSSSAQRSWSGWMMVCQPIIDGAARSPSVLMDLRSCHLSGVCLRGRPQGGRAVFIQQLHCNQPIMFILDWRGRFFGYQINQPIAWTALN